MTATGYLELLLVAANLAIWLAPAALSLWRRTFSLIHPAIILPVVVVTSMMVAMTERWFNWTGRGDFPGIRITTRFFYMEEQFFIMPLLILAAAGLAYLLGIRIGCGRAVPGETDRIHLDGKIKFVPEHVSGQLVPVSIVFSVICMIPYLLFGEGYGYFWAGALIYAFNFIPALIYAQNSRWGLVLLALGLSVVGLRGAKGDFIYYFLPLIVFLQGTLFFGSRIRMPRRLILILMIGIALVAGTIRMHQQREVWTEEDSSRSLAEKILVREYGFEVFAIMVHEGSAWGNAFGISPYGSWSLNEIKEALPSFLGVEKIRMGQEVAKEFMPLDYSYLPEAGFYRFFIFPFYYDFGWLGALGGALGIGALSGFAYRLAHNKALRLGLSWPIFVYLPIPVYSELIVNGAYSYALIHIGIAMLAVLAIARLTMLDVFGVNNYKQKLSGAVGQ